MRASGGSAKRWANFAIAALILLLLLPNLVWFLESPSPSSLIEGVIVSTVVISVVFAFFGNALWVACLVLAPFAALAPAETFYIASYGHPSSDQVLATIFATNIGETLEYFGDGIVPLCVAMLTGFLIALTAVWMARRSRSVWRSRVRTWVLTIGIGTPLAVAVATIAITQGDLATRLEASQVSLQSIIDLVDNSYPTGLPSRLLSYHRAWTAMYRSVALHDAFRFGATRVGTTQGRHIYVLAIGESSRKDRWQMFGNERITNPQLSSLPNLVPITNMITSWPTSITAIPLILTRKPITDSALSWNEASILRAMQEAGFETWWISNQMPIGKYDSPVSIYALEAQHYMFLNRATFASSGSYDEILLHPLADVVEHGKSDVFIVLHMIGSHLRYDGRYPENFVRFKPIFSDRSTDVVDGERIRNSFDNTVLYTDHVLAQLISILAKSDAVTALWFESDHGETLPTPTCSTAGHGVGSRFDFEIPAFFWYSPAYERQFPTRLAMIKQNASQPTLSANTFESLIDMTDITYPHRDTSWSLFSPDWRFHTRLVNSLEQTDFDHAIAGKGCGVLMAPAAHGE